MSRRWHIFTTNQSYFAASNVLRLFRIKRLFLSDLWATDMLHIQYESQEKDLAIPDVNTEWILAISLLCCTMTVT